MSADDELYEDDFDDQPVHRSEPAPTQSQSTMKSTSRTTTTKHSSHSIKFTDPVTTTTTTTMIAAKPTNKENYNSNTMSVGGTGSDTAHHYRISIDIRSILDLSLPQPVSLSFAYHCPLLSNHPIVSAPGTSVRPHTKTDVVNGFHLFEFIIPHSQFRHYTESHPLTIDLVTESVNGSGSVSVGILYVSLNALLYSPVHQKPDLTPVHVVDQHVTVYRPTTKKVTVSANGSGGGGGGGIDMIGDSEIRQYKLVRIGKCRIVMTLEDFGAIKSQSLAQSQSQSVSPPPQPQSQPHTAAALSPAIPMPPATTTTGSATMTVTSSVAGASADRSAAEYQVAWELELWRRSEQSKHEQKWRDMESQKLLFLEREWKNQIQKKEEKYQYKQKEMERLEKKLQLTLGEVMQKEKLLYEREAELELQLAQQSKSQQLSKSEAELAVARVKDYHSHAAAMSKRIIADLSQQTELLKSKLMSEELRNRTVEQEFHRYKAAVSKSTVGELKIALIEKEMLLRQWEAKYQLLENDNQKLNKELAKNREIIQQLKQEIEDREKDFLLQEKKNLLSMKAELAMKQRTQGVKRDREELEGIRARLRLVTSGSDSEAAPVASDSSSGENQQQYPTFYDDSANVVPLSLEAIEQQRKQTHPQSPPLPPQSQSQSLEAASESVTEESKYASVSAVPERRTSPMTVQHLQSSEVNDTHAHRLHQQQLSPQFRSRPHTHIHEHYPHYEQLQRQLEQEQSQSPPKSYEEQKGNPTDALFVEEYEKTVPSSRAQHHHQQYDDEHSDDAGYSDNDRTEHQQQSVPAPAPVAVRHIHGFASSDQAKLRHTHTNKHAHAHVSHAIISPRTAQRLAQRRSAEAVRHLSQLQHSDPKSESERRQREKSQQRRQAWQRESQRERVIVGKHHSGNSGQLKKKAVLTPKVNRIKGHGVVPVSDRSTSTHIDSGKGSTFDDDDLAVLMNAEVEPRSDSPPTPTPEQSFTSYSGNSQSEPRLPSASSFVPMHRAAGQRQQPS